MTLLGGFRSLENPTQPLTSTALADWLTGGSRSGAGVAVTEQRVLGLPAYYRALAVTAGTLATLPVKVYRKGTRERVLQATVLSQKANPRQTSVEWRVTTFLHQFAWGNAYSRKIRDGSGIVREVWPIHPSAVRVEPVEPTAADPAGKLFLIRTLKGSEDRLTSREILHLPYMSMDGISGVRPLEAFRQSLGIAIAGDDATAAFIANGSRLSGILTTDKSLDQPGAERWKARWKELTSGVANTGDVGVLDGGAKFQPISIPPADAQMLQGRQWSVDEIGRMVGVPPHVIGNVSGSTSWGTGIEQQVLGWVKFTLQLPITAAEERWSDELLAGPWYAKHSLKALLRGDSAAQSAWYHSMIMDGWGVRNEVRDYEDLEPIDGLDEPIVPSNMTLISVDGEIVPLSAKGADNSAAATA